MPNHPRPAGETREDYLVRCPQCGHEFHRVGHRQTFDPEKLAESLEDGFVIRELGSVKERKLWGLWRQRFRKLFGLRRYKPGDTCYFIAQRVRQDTLAFRPSTDSGRTPHHHRRLADHRFREATR